MTIVRSVLLALVPLLWFSSARAQEAPQPSVPFTALPVLGSGNGPHPLPAVPRYHGTVAWTSQWHFGLTPGPFFVDLHPYTVIKPTGATIRKGMHVLVYGHMQLELTPGHPTIDASAVICEPPY